MVNVTSKIENDKLIYFLEGRIDSSNAQSVEEQIISFREGNEELDIVVDAEKLEYISSAGLRIMLRLRKLCPDLKIINVSSEVYDIFEMTGFTEMITIEKAYRVLSVEGCEVIGQGSNGKVYRIDPDTIIKVYRNPDALPEIHQERELARRALVIGIPTAIPYDVVKVGDGYGSVFELLNAKSFAKLITQDPDNFDHYIKLYVDLLKDIHSTEEKDGIMPSMKEVAVKWAKFDEEHLPGDYGKKLVELVEAVPEDRHVLHGDYHVKNVMMQNGEVLLIDMDTLCTGNPVFELGSVYNAYIGFGIDDPKKVEDFMDLPYDLTAKIWKKFLKLYVGSDDEAKLKEVEDKAKLIGLMRLLRRTIRREPENTGLINMCKKEICGILDRIDDLTL